MRAYLEHVALKVADIDWHIRFFGEVLGMTLREEIPASGQLPRQVWTLGGLQLAEDPGFTGPEGRLMHLGIFVEDQAAVLKAAKAWGVTAFPWAVILLMLLALIGASQTATQHLSRPAIHSLNRHG